MNHLCLEPIYIPPPKNHCSGSLGVYYTVRQILSMNITPIPLLTSTVSGDCYEPVILTSNKVVVKATEKEKYEKVLNRTPNLSFRDVVVVNKFTSRERQSAGLK